MNVIANKPSDVSHVSPAQKSLLARYYYSAAAAVLLGFMFVGFQPFFMRGQAYPGRPLAPPIKTLIILHGIAMSGWGLLFLVQPLLIASRSKRVHMKLGVVGVILAAAIFFLGFKLGIDSTRVGLQFEPPGFKIWGLPHKQFMAVPIFSILLFATFVAIGIFNRRKPNIHRPMMLLATLAAMPAAISRIDAISNLYLNTVWERVFGPFLSTLVVGAILLLLGWAIMRKFDRWYAVGFASLTIAFALIMRIATTGAWDRIASMLLA